MSDDILWTKDPLILFDKISEIIPYDLPKHRQMNALMRLIIIGLAVYLIYTIGILNILLVVIIISALYIVTSNTNDFVVPQTRSFETNIHNNTQYGNDAIERNQTYCDLYMRPDDVQPIIYYDHMDALGLYNANF